MARPNQLSRRLARQVARVVQEWAAGNDDLSAAEVEGLDRWQRLIQVQRDLERRTIRKWLAIAGGTIGVLLALLGLLRQPTIDVEGRIVGSDVALTTGASQIVRFQAPLAGIRIAGLDSVEIPDRQAVSGSRVLRVSRLRIKSRPSAALGFEQLLLPAGARLSFTARHMTPAFRVSGSCHRACVPGLIRLAALGRLAIELDGNARALDVSPAMAEPVVAYFGSSWIDVDLAPLPEAPPLRLTGLSADSVRFEGHEAISEGSLEAYSPLPILKRAEITIANLNNRVDTITAGSIVRLTGPRVEVQTLEIAGDSIVFRFSGTLSDLERGTTQHAVRLMPSLLDVLYATYGTHVLWACLGLVAAGLAALTRWLPDAL